jgi:hypothetical protein
MTAAMLMETVLLMIRTDPGYRSVDDRYAHLMDPTKYNSKPKGGAGSGDARAGGWGGGRRSSGRDRAGKREAAKKAD